MKFNGDYDKVVGNRKQEFLKKCTERAPEGVVCSDVRKGSIVVQMDGPAEKVEEDVSKMVSAGKLDLPGFEAGEMVEEVEPDLSDLETAGVVVGDDSQADDTGSKETKSSSVNLGLGWPAASASLLLAAFNVI